MVHCGAQAQQKMAELQGHKLETLSEITATPTSQLKFITDAWCQVRVFWPKFVLNAEDHNTVRQDLSLQSGCVQACQPLAGLHGQGLVHSIGLLVVRCPAYASR